MDQTNSAFDCCNDHRAISCKIYGNEFRRRSSNGSLSQIFPFEPTKSNDVKVLISNGKSFGMINIIDVDGLDARPFNPTTLQLPSGARTRIHCHRSTSTGRYSGWRCQGRVHQLCSISASCVLCWFDNRRRYNENTKSNKIESTLVHVMILNYLRVFWYISKVRWKLA